jgi:hypothetical protein
VELKIGGNLLTLLDHWMQTLQGQWAFSLPCGGGLSPGTQPNPALVHKLASCLIVACVLVLLD